MNQNVEDNNVPGLNDYKFNCNTCDYHTNIIQNWNNHIISERHTRGGKKTTRCSHCIYIAKTHYNLQQHILSQHATKEEKIKHKYYCEICDVLSTCEQYYLKHISSNKHKKRLQIIDV
jgi:hypothetical protein